MKKAIDYDHKAFKTIYNKIVEKELLVPIFQRGFVWKTDDIVSFLNSILNDEPFGFIIQWKPSETLKLPTKNTIIETINAKGKTSLHPYYIIDGQQRLTSLFWIFNWRQFQNEPELKLYKNLLNRIYYDFKNQEFVKLKSAKNKLEKAEQSRYLELALAIPGFELKRETEDQLWINLSSQQKDEIAQINDRLKNISLGIILLENYNLEETIDVFNKINTKGQKLTTFDIINSKWYEKDFLLEDYFEEIYQTTTKFGFSPKSLNSALLADSLYFILNEKPIISSNEKLEFDLSQLGSPEQIKQTLQRFQEVVIKTCKILHNFGYDERTLPSFNIIKWFTYLINKRSLLKLKELTNKENELLKQYIATIALNNYYSRATSQKLLRNIEFVNQFLKLGAKLDLKILFAKDHDIKETSCTSELVLTTKYHENSMLSRFFDYVMLQQNAIIDIKTGNEIKNHHNSQLHLHHIFPLKAKKEDKTYNEVYDEINSYANLMVLSENTNRAIKNFAPSQYYSRLKQENNQLDHHLATYFIDATDLQNDHFENFIEKRAQKIADYINKTYLQKSEF